jgi:hypothetical protein
MNKKQIIDLVLSDYSLDQQTQLRQAFRNNPLLLDACIKQTFGGRLEELRKGHYFLK